MTFFTIAAVKVIASVTCIQQNSGHQVPCSQEPVVTILNYQTSWFGDRSLFNYVIFCLV